MKGSAVKKQFGNDAVRISGSGRPALFLHGVPDTSILWTDVIKDLTDICTCYAPDLPGFGNSGISPDFKFDLESYGCYVNELLDRLEIDEPVLLVLHDWGGIFGLSFASQFPERVAGIVAAGVPFTHLYRWHPYGRIWRTPILGELSMAILNQPLFRLEVARGSVALSDETIERMYFSTNVSKTRSTILKLYRSASPHLFTALQARLREAIDSNLVDLVWGDEDPYVPSQYGRQIPHKRMEILEGCGHWVPSEHPAAMIRIIRERISVSSPSTPAECSSADNVGATGKNNSAHFPDT